MITTQALEEFKEKLIAASVKESSESSNTHNAQGESYLSLPWIIDSGATNHMTGSPKKFPSYKPRSGREKSMYC